MKTFPLRLAQRLFGCGLLLTALAVSVSGQSNSATPFCFTTLAGSPSVGSSDGPGNVARFNGPYGAALDVAGNVYVTDFNNHTIRKISPAGQVVTIAGKAGSSGSTDGPATDARFSGPTGLAVDRYGTVYVADAGNDTIRQITPAGMVTTLAGLAGSPGSADGTGSAARFYGLAGLTLDPAGNLYAVDEGYHTIRKITAAGLVTTLAGTPELNHLPEGVPNGYVVRPEAIDGTGSEAHFSEPWGVAVDATGNLYVTDLGNIRKITPAGVVTTFADQGGRKSTIDLGNNGAYGVAVGKTGDLYVTNGATLRKISPNGAITILAGKEGNTTEGAPWFGLFGVAVDATGTVYVTAEDANNSVLKISPGGLVSTLAGLSIYESRGSANGIGSSSRFNYPQAVAVDGSGNLYVADSENDAIRKITPSGLVTTFAGTPGSPGSNDGPGSAAQFHVPAGLATDASGNLYVADSWNNTVRKITPAGVVTTLAGLAGTSGSTDGTGSAARFNAPYRLGADAVGNVYVDDALNRTIRKITPAGVVTTLAGELTGSLAVDGPGNLYVIDSAKRVVRKITPAGTATETVITPEDPAETNGFYLNGIVVDGTGTIYGTANCTVRKISPTGMMTTLGGQDGISGSTDGLGADARFTWMAGIALDGTGNLYIADSYNNTLRKGQIAGAPVIIAQPLSQTATTGESVQFTVTAGGAPAPTYQWYFNGSAFTSATSATLTFANARTTDAGDYTVVVTNSLGSVTSAKATLMVSAAPITAPTGTSSGGGAMEAWFVTILAAGALLRCGLPRRAQ